ncbi:MAG TPA: hypothetical protein VIY27_08890, partial [Myxococcota bacterium]
MLDAWAVASSEGLLLGTHEGSIEEAHDFAKRFTGPGGVVYLDGMMRVYEGGGEGVLPIAANISEAARIAKEKRKLTTYAETAPFAEQPALAVSALGFDAPIDIDDVLELSLEEAYRAIEPFFIDLPAHTKHPKKEPRAWQRLPAPGSRPDYQERVDSIVDSSADGLIGGNYKMNKSDPRQQYAKAAGLSIAPNVFGFKGAMRSRTGETVCLRATPECMAVCLLFTGQNVMGVRANELKAAKSKAFLNEPHAFCRMLYASIDAWSCRKASFGYEPYIRLNVYSDIPWELLWPDLFDEFPDVQFYDYTKIPGRAALPDNYDLTFSYSGRNRADTIHEVTVLNRRVAAVFLTPKHKLPAVWRDREGRGPGLRVIDGEVSDLRPLDPPNDEDPTPVCVGLTYKPPKGRYNKQQPKKVDVFIIPCEKNDDGSVIVAVAPRHT